MTKTVWIVSELEGSPTDALLMQGAQARGCRATLARPSTLGLQFGAVGPTLVDSPQPWPDLVIARTGASASPGALDSLAHFEAMGIPVVNSLEATFRVRDKWRCGLRLAAAGVPVPRSFRPRAGADPGDFSTVLGPPPWYIKRPVGTQGKGVARVDSLASLRSVLDLVGADVFVQSHAPGAEDGDLRVLVLQGRVHSAMRRIPSESDARANLHCGATAHAVSLEPSWVQVAEEAAQTVDLDVAGVDLVVGSDGPLVLEVNAAPGLSGLVDIHGRGVLEEVLSAYGL